MIKPRTITLEILRITSLSCLRMFNSLRTTHLVNLLLLILVYWLFHRCYRQVCRWCLVKDNDIITESWSKLTYDVLSIPMNIIDINNISSDTHSVILFSDNTSMIFPSLSLTSKRSSVMTQSP